MKLKQKMALMLSGVMFAGLVAVISPVEVKATLNTEEAPLTVPPNMSGFSSQPNGTSANTMLTSEALLASKTGTFDYNGTTYTAYTGFISQTSGSNWYDAQAFVKQLNDNSVDGCTSWTLLLNPDMAFEWWQSTAASETDKNVQNGIKYGQTSFGNVHRVLSAVGSGHRAYDWNCQSGKFGIDNGTNVDYVKQVAWRNNLGKSLSHYTIGFVVLRS